MASSILEETPRATVQRVYSSPQPRGKKVAQLRDTIESQLAVSSTYLMIVLRWNAELNFDIQCQKLMRIVHQLV